MPKHGSAEPPDRLLQAVEPHQAHDRRRLAAGDHETVEAVELLRQPHLDHVRAERAQHRRVLAKVALHSEDADRHALNCRFRLRESPCRRANRSPSSPSARIRSPAPDVPESDLPGVDAALGVADLERDEDADERQPVLDEVRRRGEDPDRAEHGVARAAERVGAGDIGDGKQADEDPAGVAVDEREHAASECQTTHKVEPEAERLAAGAVDRVARRNQDEPGDDGHDLLGAEVDEREPEDERDRKHEQRRTETPESHSAAAIVSSSSRNLPGSNRCRRRRRGCRSRSPASLRRRRRNDCERGEDARGDQTACPLEREREPSAAAVASALKPTRAALPWSSPRIPSRDVVAKRATIAPM